MNLEGVERVLTERREHVSVDVHFMQKVLYIKADVYWLKKKTKSNCWREVVC